MLRRIPLDLQEPGKKESAANERGGVSVNYAGFYWLQDHVEVPVQLGNTHEKPDLVLNIEALAKTFYI